MRGNPRAATLGRWLGWALVLGAAAALISACGTSAAVRTSPRPKHKAKPHRVVVKPKLALHGIHKIRHVVIIMQENRSFDSYFGTYKGADGIPGLAGNPGRVPCVPDPTPLHATLPAALPRP